MYTKVFHFGTEITEHDLFTDEKGYGFINQEQIPGKTKSEQSLYSGGWNLRKNALVDCKNSLHSTEHGVEITLDRFVMIFKIRVPEEGSYKITLTSKAGVDGIQDMMLFSGRRNLIERDIQVNPGETYTKSFFVFTAPYIPALTSIPCTEKAIYISISGKHASLSELTIEKQDAPVIYVAGDSTLTDQNALFPYYPYGSCAGWAQVMAQYFDSVAICNQAHSGMTSNCFRDDGHWDIVKERLKENDIVFLQFGHNDQKRRNLAAFGGYINNLRWYVKEIKAHGAFPIIVSPISRIPFQDNGKYRSLLAMHALACKEAANECNVPFIDLHALTFHYWCQLGEEQAKDYFMKGDITHTNDYGANLIASYVVSEILRQNIEPLSTLLSFQEKKAMLPEQDTKEVPVEPADGGMFDIDIPYIDIDGIPQYDDMILAFRKGLFDPCVMHLHPTEPMPRAQFLMVYFKALRMNGKRPYLGEFCDISRYEWDSSYIQACVEENLIDPSTVPNGRFRPDDALTNAEYASFLIRGMAESADKRNISMNDCVTAAKKQHFLAADAIADNIISRADCYKGLVTFMDSMNNADKSLPSDVEVHPVG